MKVNHFFDLVVAVRDHEGAVERFSRLFGVQPLEVANPGPDARCTVFPIGSKEKEVMTFSVVSSRDSSHPINRRIETHGEGVILLGFEFDSLDQAVEQARSGGVTFTTREPIEYEYGRRVHVDEETTFGAPIFLAEHKPGYWEEILRGR
jgi:hypothetical protein